MERVRIAKAIKKAVLKKGNERCMYCGKKLNDATLTIEHVRPLAKNGSNKAENLMPACSRCNSFKGSKTKNEFRLLLRGLIGKSELSPTERKMFDWYGLKQVKNKKDFLFYCDRQKPKRSHTNHVEIDIGYF